MKDSKKYIQKEAQVKISRKDALRKAGKYAAFTAAATVLILTPLKAQAGSTPADLGSGFRGGDPASPPDDDKKNFRHTRPSENHRPGR